MSCQDLKKCEVNTLVRVCDATYDKTPVEKEGIQVLVRVETRTYLWWPLLLYGFAFFNSLLLSPLGLALR